MRFLAALTLLVGLMATEPAPSTASSAGSAAARPDLVAALAVLHAWDERRAQAWAEVDVAALRSLYVRGSGAGRADLRLLHAYGERGFVVRRLETQIFAVRVLRRDRATMSLRVLDRVAGGEVVRDGHAQALSSTPPVTRTVELRRVSGRWQVETVTGRSSGPRAARR